MNGPNKAFVNQKELAFAEDIFTQIPGIGSITMGVSNNIGENYHLCDGSIINHKYQDLIELIGENSTYFSPYQVDIDKSTIPENCYIRESSQISLVNSKCVIRAVYTSNNGQNNYYGYLYADSIFDTFKFVQLENDYTSIAYDETLKNYVLLHTQFSTNSGICTMTIQYSSNIEGPYTSNVITSNQMAPVNFGKHVVDNGHLVVLARITTQSYRFYRIAKDDYRNSDAVTIQAYYDYGRNDMVIAYGNGYFCFYFKSTNSASSNTVSVYYANSKNTTVSWYSSSFDIKNVSYATSLYYDNCGKQFCVVTPNSISNPSILYIYNAEVPNSWSERQITFQTITIRNSLSIQIASCENVTYVVLSDSACSEHAVKILENRGTGFVDSTIELFSLYKPTMIQVSINMVFSYCENGVLAGYPVVDTTNKILYVCVQGVRYPEIDLDNTVNTFIRCK